MPGLDFSALEAAVERNTTVDGSAKALITMLNSLYAETKGDPAKVAALTARLNGEHDSLAEAVTANTPAAEPPAEPPPA